MKFWLISAFLVCFCSTAVAQPISGSAGPSANGSALSPSTVDASTVTTQNLNVGSAAGLADYVRVGAGTAGYLTVPSGYLTVTRTGYSEIQNNGTSGGAWKCNGGADCLIDAISGGNIQMRVNGTAIATAKAAGLGVGTASPGATLDVNGASAFRGASTFIASATVSGVLDSHLKINHPSGVARMDITGTSGQQLALNGGVDTYFDGPGSGVFHFRTNGGAENVYMNTAGLGIGVAATLGKLQLDGGAAAGQATLDGDVGGCIMLQDTDNAGWTECDALNGVLSCSIDADGVCD